MKVHRLSRCRSFALAILCLLLIDDVGEAQAEKDRTFAGQFGLVLVGRDNLESLGQQYRSGVLLGFDAGVELSLEDSEWSVGLALTTLVRGYYFASNSSAVDQTVDVTEMSMGLRIRRQWPAGSRQHILGTFGGGFTASSVPLPPAFDRRYVGLYSGIGYNRRLAGEWTWGLETRYASYFDGPSNLSLLASVTAGFGK
jgi:hypothetical protein